MFESTGHVVDADTHITYVGRNPTWMLWNPAIVDRLLDVLGVWACQTE